MSRAPWGNGSKICNKQGPQRGGEIARGTRGEEMTSIFSAFTRDFLLQYYLAERQQKTCFLGLTPVRQAKFAIYCTVQVPIGMG